MKFSLGFNVLILALTTPSVWLLCTAEETYTTTIETRGLRGKASVRKRSIHHYDHTTNDKSHESLLDPRPQHKFQSDHVKEIQLVDQQKITEAERARQQMRRNDKSLHVLPRGDLNRNFNSSLFEELHNAPFEIYESVFGVGKEEREESFPVFIIPDWKKDTTGVFSGFSRTASPLTFQNMQLLLSWDDIVEASTGAEAELMNFIDRNNFEASLFIGKTLGDAASHVPFLGLIVSYHQSSLKNILVPFAKLENFFHDTSEKHLLSESLEQLEHDTLHQMLDEERANNSTNSFFHPEIVEDTQNNNKKAQLEDIEALHFRRLFQLLIRRTFLFSFGYADCLKVEPHNLRACLDDTFSLVVQMEATVRNALDDQLIGELAELTKITTHSKVREACVSVSPGSYGINECSAPSSHSSFRGIGGAGRTFTSQATSVLR